MEETAFADVQDWLGGENLRRKGEKWIADICLPDDEALIRKIVGLGSCVKVMSPENVKLRVHEEAKKIAALYE